MLAHRPTPSPSRLPLLGLLLVVTSVMLGIGCDRPPGSGEANGKPGTGEVGGSAAAAPTDPAAVAEPKTTETATASTFEALPDPDAPARAVVSPGPAAPTLMFTASLKGYVEPCGCTLDVNLGGIDRISGYVRALAALEHGSLFLDVGNTFFESTDLDARDRDQALLKAGLLADGLAAMGAVSTTPGPLDMALGVDTYRRLVADAGLPVTVANLSADGVMLGEASRVLEIPRREGTSTLRILLVGIVDPALFEGLDGIDVSEPGPALDLALAQRSERPVDVTIVVAQGRLAFARELATAERGLDFVLVGVDPKEGDAPTWAGATALLEAFSQGRHLGVLKLYANTVGAYVNARAGSQEALDRLDRRIAYLDQALTKAGPPRPGEESDFVTRKRQELGGLRDERLAMSLDSVVAPADSNAFAFFSVPMEPGYAKDAAVTRRMAQYQEDIAALYARLKPALPALAEGQAGFVGDEVCAGCHEAAHAQWSGTPHKQAYTDLVGRQREHDPECLRCHVTGYGKPGGAIIGALGNLGGVQCEACHGAGSLHVASPDAVKPSRAVDKEVCLGCHDAQNSPRFDDATYRPALLGPGHGG